MLQCHQERVHVWPGLHVPKVQYGTCTCRNLRSSLQWSTFSHVICIVKPNFKPCLTGMENQKGVYSRAFQVVMKGVGLEHPDTAYWIWKCLKGGACCGLGKRNWGSFKFSQLWLLVFVFVWDVWSKEKLLWTPALKQHWAWHYKTWWLQPRFCFYRTAYWRNPMITGWR